MAHEVRFDKISYSVYGNSRDSTHATLGFNGQRKDLVSGTYLLGNGHRGYSPLNMRFHSPDGLSPFGAGGLNSYAYCQGDPVNFVDPTGRSPQWPRWLNRIFSVVGESIFNIPSKKSASTSAYDVFTRQEQARMRFRDVTQRETLIDGNIRRIERRFEAAEVELLIALEADEPLRMKWLQEAREIFTQRNAPLRDPVAGSSTAYPHQQERFFIDPSLKRLNEIHRKLRRGEGVRGMEEMTPSGEGIPALRGAGIPS